MDLLVIVSIIGLLIPLAYITHIIVRTWINPAALFLAVWGVNIIVFILAKNLYVQVPWDTWLLIALACTAFYAGSLTVWIANSGSALDTSNPDPTRRQTCLQGTIDRKRMKLSIIMIILVGGLFFTTYLRHLINMHGLSGILFTLLDTRAYMRDEGTLPGFHFLYFWEIVLPITVLYVLLFGARSNLLLLLTAIVCTLFLVFTGAKTNVFKSFIWSLTIYSILRLEFIQLQKLSVIGLLIGATGIGAFFAHTGFTGELAGPAEQATEVVYRFSAQFPTFSALINDSDVSFQHGKLLFLPLVKVIAVAFPDVSVPSHILDFYNTPEPFNLATFLDVFYRDFGPIGVIGMPWILGLFCGAVTTMFQQDKDSLFVFFLMSVILMWVMESPNAAGFIKPNYWFQLIMIFIVHRFVTVRSPNARKINFPC